MKAHLAVKATMFAVFIPGTVVVCLPYLILDRFAAVDWPAFSAVAAFAGLLALVAAALLLYCIWGFAAYGQGTPAPFDPPKALVIRGAYRYTRNPMYLAICLMLLAEAAFFRSVDLLAYAVIVFLGFFLFVFLYEEPHLRHQFGGRYEEYCRSVPRWGFTVRPFDGGLNTR